jgi:aspartyl-tRNA(Asn)/glutamyl-tRNA(Gln) amidotransferase subunit B
VIGLEVHAQVTSNAKLFSGASTEFGAEPNTQVSLVDAAMPGMLPVPNRECIRQAVRTGMALDAQINRWSRFDRKNYFYADLPQGYQISQLYHPIVGEGEIEILLDERTRAAKTIGIERIHVEQDAGKLMHDQHPSLSYVDLNRSGVALMEIVSKPDMRSPEEAGAYLASCDRSCATSARATAIWSRARCAPTSTSACASPGEPFGTRTETKNVNSVRFIMAVIEHEANRQVECSRSGGTIVQETRLFDPDKGETRSLRSKEDAHDYRYFPDPDLLPLELDDASSRNAAPACPSCPTPSAAATRRLGDHRLQCRVLTAEVETARWFEACSTGAAREPAAPPTG